MTSAAIVLVVLAGAVWATRWLCRRQPSLAGVVPWLATLVIALFLAVAFLDRPFGSGTDEVVYHRQAVSVRLSWILTGGLDADYLRLDGGKTGWPTILGTLYWVTGSLDPYLGVLVNAVVSYLALLLVAAAGNRVWGERQWRQWVGLVLVASPPVLIFGASLLREAWVWLAVAIAVHALLYLCDRRWRPGGLTLVLAVAIAFWIRAPLSAIILGAVLGALLAAWVWQRLDISGAVVAMALMAVLGLQALAQVTAAFGYSAEALFATRDYLAVSASTGFAPSDPFTPLGLARALVQVGIGPMPWEYRPSPVWGWVFVNWVYWVVVIGLVLRAMRRAGVTFAAVALVVFACILLAGLAVALTNYGIVVRMRGTVLIALLPLVWGCLQPLRRGSQERSRELVR